MHGFISFCWCFPFVEEIEKLDEPVLAVFGPYEGVKMLQKQVHGLRKPTMYTVLCVNINASIESSFCFALKMSKVHVQALIFYSKTMESYLSIII